MSISILYVRCSTIDQRTDRQRVNEKDFDKVIEDKCSGSIPMFDRDGGVELKNLIEKNVVKSISVWQIDRCGRNLRDVINFIHFTTQFKIPIQKSYYENTSFDTYFEAVNEINDLRSIRFMRMLLSGFEEDVVLRFGTLDLVRGDWRRYNKPLNEDVLSNTNTTLDISTVNILENENRIPINYVLPPEIQREQINNNNTIIRQNEQSLAFRICDLKPMDSRGIYKGVDLDMRQYSKLRMFIHAESLPGNEPLPGTDSEDEYDKRMTAFIRLGTDYQDNFYQIEIPLKPSSYTENISNRLTAEEVWIPDSNSLEIPIDLLSKLKAKALQQLGLGETLYFDEELNPIQEFTPISSLPGIKKYKLAIE
mgnify:CR=1 FL=1